MTARNIVNLRIQFPEQICEPFLIFLFENVIFREEDQYPPPQIFKIICLESRVILQHIYTLEAVDKSLLIVQVRRHGLIEPSAIFPILFRFTFQKSRALFQQLWRGFHPVLRIGRTIPQIAEVYPTP